MSAHTPGPWVVYDDSNDGKTNRIEIVAIGKTIAHIYHSVPAEDLPNARLIAAAPELLEALADYVAAASGAPKSCGHAHDCVCPGDKARAVIAKAKGEA